METNMDTTTSPEEFIEMLFFVHDEFAWVKVSLAHDEVEYSAEGVAKRHPDDKPDRNTAFWVATARALETLAGKAHRQAEGRVKHNDQMREASELAKSQERPTEEEIEARRKASKSRRSPKPAATTKKKRKKD